MSIKLYTGLQGSGKSYEVVSVVILGALRDGRRVVSNIAGLEYVLMCEMLIAEGVPAEKIGTLLQVQHEDVLKPNFFRTDTDDKTGFETILQGGDVLALDEIWRFWDKDSQVSERHQNFFRMHRHMLHQVSGLSCEIVLLTQDSADVCRKIRNVVEKTYAMSKLTALGMDGRYRVDIYSRARFTSRTKPISSIQKSYDSKYFSLYKSHSAGGDVTDPKEKSVDRRGTVWGNPLFKYGLPLSLLLAIPAFIFLYRYMHPKPAEVAPAAVASPVPAPASRPAHKADEPQITSWRVVGHYMLGEKLIFMIRRGSSVRLLVDPPAYKITQFDSSVLLPEGGFATSWVVDERKGGVL